jgi:hypothetical protein
MQNPAVMTSEHPADKILQMLSMLALLVGQLCRCCVVQSLLLPDNMVHVQPAVAAADDIC